MNSRRAFAEDEYQQLVARRRRRRQTMIGLTAVAITVLALVAVAVDRLLRPGAFPIKELRLEGEFVHLDPDMVHNAVLDELGDNYFSLDLQRIERAVEDLAWAYRATVKRSWPNGLVVRVEEQRPVARWGEKNWLNDQAQIIHLEQAADSKDMVFLSGPDSTAAEVWNKYNQWSQELAGMGLRIDALSVDDRFAWSLRATAKGSGSGVEILLGLDEHDRRMRRFFDSYTLLQQQGSVPLTVDLRYPNGLAVTRTDQQGDEVAYTRLNDE